jgi:nitrite reductase/ring-hydroxylating ferredoxin subunit
MRERTRKAIELPGDENIAFSHESDGLRQTGAVCLCAGCTILENALAPGGARRVKLKRDFLPVGRNSCITDLDHCDFPGLVRFAVRQSSCPSCHYQASFSDKGTIDREEIDCRTHGWRRDGAC